MASRKPGQQEMAQTDASTRSSSPFWRSRASSGRAQSGSRQNVVIGAAYSHADMLKFDALNLGANSRPHTPPHSSPRSSPNPSTSRQLQQSPERKSHPSITSPLTSSWDIRNNIDTEEYDDDDDDGEYVYDDDEDEFGLPSIASMRKKKKPTDTQYPFPIRTTTYHDRDQALNSIRPSHLTESASFDIAEERSPLSYPSTKKSEGKILRPQYRDILTDPANSLHLINHPRLSPKATAKEVEAHNTRISRINKFKRLLQASSISLPELRTAAWSGVPEEVRAMTWQVLLGYLPVNSERRVSTLDRKRKEYLDGVKQAFGTGSITNQKAVNAGLAGLASSPQVTSGKGRGLDEAVWHQISIDVPRTNPHIPLYQFEATQRSLERILYVWALRHPASGYVQGINDLATPFWQVFLGTYVTDFDVEKGMDPGQLPKPVLDAVEADTFWCLSKLLDGIQDNYIHAQPGIHRQVAALRDLTTRIDERLAKHFERENVEYMQFSFRWMNCLLMREITIKNTIRMWDTYLSEEDGFSQFHLYVCAAFLVKWSDQLLKMKFQDILMFLQALPSKDWSEKDVELLLSEAFIWQSLFRGSRAHLKQSSTAMPMGSLGPPG